MPKFTVPVQPDLAAAVAKILRSVANDPANEQWLKDLAVTSRGVNDLCDFITDNPANLAIVGDDEMIVGRSQYDFLKQERDANHQLACSLERSLAAYRRKAEAFGAIASICETHRLLDQAEAPRG